MSPSTLPSEVRSDDLILVYTARSAKMLVVKSTANDEPTSNTSLITVQNVSYHIPDHKGYWALSGPDVYYVNQGEPWKHNYCLSNSCDGNGDDGDDGSQTLLSPALYSMTRPWRRADGQQEDMMILPRPHGRDVLKHYFNNSCPSCDTTAWICPGCRDTRQLFPELRGNCDTNQACPVCKGDEFAFNDSAAIEELDGLEEQLGVYRSQYKDSICAEELQELKDVALAVLRERYEATIERKMEMGMPVEDLDEMMKSWKENYYDVDE